MEWEIKRRPIIVCLRAGVLCFGEKRRPGYDRLHTLKVAENMPLSLKAIQIHFLERFRVTQKSQNFSRSAHVSIIFWRSKLAGWKISTWSKWPLSSVLFFSIHALRWLTCLFNSFKSNQKTVFNQIPVFLQLSLMSFIYFFIYFLPLYSGKTITDMVSVLIIGLVIIRFPLGLRANKQGQRGRPLSVTCGWLHCAG